MAAPAFPGLFQQFFHQPAAADFVAVGQHLVLDAQHRPDVGNGNAGDFHYLLRGDGEKLHRRVTSLGEYAEKPLLESFFHLQKLLSFGYVKGAAPHGRPGWLLLTASDFQKDKPADDEYHESDGNDRF